MTTLTGHCLCGSSYRITCDDPIVTGAVTLWWQVHTGPGHGPATPSQCRAARLRAQRQPQDTPPCQMDVSSVKP